MLLNGSKRAAYDKVTAWLRTPEVQKRIMTETLRRPAIPGVALDPRFPSRTLIELPFPAKLDTLEYADHDLPRRDPPARVGGVRPRRVGVDGRRPDEPAQVRDEGADRARTESITGQFARFRAREQVTIVTFNDSVQDIREFTIDDTSPNSAGMTAIRDYIDGLQAGGGTAIYSALEAAYDIVQKAQASRPEPPLLDRADDRRREQRRRRPGPVQGGLRGPARRPVRRSTRIRSCSARRARRRWPRSRRRPAAPLFDATTTRSRRTSTTSSTSRSATFAPSVPARRASIDLHVPSSLARRPTACSDSSEVRICRVFFDEIHLLRPSVRTRECSSRRCPRRVRASAHAEEYQAT